MYILNHFVLSPLIFVSSFTDRKLSPSCQPSADSSSDTSNSTQQVGRSDPATSRNVAYCDDGDPVATNNGEHYDPTTAPNLAYTAGVNDLTYDYIS